MRVRIGVQGHEPLHITVNDQRNPPYHTRTLDTTMTAKTHRRASVAREIRTAKLGSARDAIGTLTPDCEIYVLTFGQFSLIDALVAIIEQTGPAEVDLSTWTAANADLTTASKLLEVSAIKKMRFLVDRSFLTRKPEYCAAMRRLFGDECIRTARSHAKFAAIRNDDWQIAVRTSMNLNTNPRLENIEISDDPALCGFMTSVVDEVFAEQQPSLFEQGLPRLDGIANTRSTGGVAVGKVTAGGMAATGVRRAS